MTPGTDIGLPPGVVLGPGSRILDLGCGTGLQARALAAPGHRVVAVDPDLDAVGTAASLAREAGLVLSHLVADGRALPFADASFDVVLCRDVLHWMPDAESLERLMGEGWRVLRPRGVWAGRCRVADDAWPSAAGRVAGEAVARGGAAGNAWRPPARRELDAFLRRAGGRWIAAPGGPRGADGETVAAFAARKG